MWEQYRFRLGEEPSHTNLSYETFFAQKVIRVVTLFIIQNIHVVLVA